MGIVVFCPSGHRIKVKDYLAGRRGICPTCGGRFRIPMRSDSAAVAPSFEEKPVEALLALDEPMIVDPPPAAQAARGLDGLGGIPDAIDEFAAASWCVAVPGGTPSAVMSGDDMRRWLASEAVTGGELVWRSDWTDWRAVADVFPDRRPRP